ncbi:hypothetical protein D3C74_433320 [compost metagenome]
MARRALRGGALVVTDVIVIFLDSGNHVCATMRLVPSITRDFRAVKPLRRRAQKGSGRYKA